MTYLFGPDSSTAMDTLKRQGFGEWAQPTAEVKLPKDISSVDSEILADLFTRLTAWQNYAGMQLAAAQVDEAALDRKRDIAYAKSMAARGGGRGEKVTVLKAQASSDPVIADLDERLAKAFAYRKLLEAVYNNFEREIALVSREITRRTNDQRAFRKDRFTA